MQQQESTVKFLNGVVSSSARAKSLIKDWILLSIANLPATNSSPLLSNVRHFLGMIIPFCNI